MISPAKMNLLVLISGNSQAQPFASIKSCLLNINEQTNPIYLLLISMMRTITFPSHGYFDFRHSLVWVSLLWERSKQQIVIKAQHLEFSYSMFYLYLTVTTGANTTDTNQWNFLSCPLENECNNTHHTCDLEKQNCIDLELGHYCECKEGYELMWVENIVLDPSLTIKGC